MHQALHQMKGLIKLHNPGKFIESNIFGSHFRGFQVGVTPQAFILNLFWVVFHGILQFAQNVYK